MHGIAYSLVIASKTMLFGKMILQAVLAMLFSSVHYYSVLLSYNTRFRSLESVGRRILQYGQGRSKRSI